MIDQGCNIRGGGPWFALIVQGVLSSRNLITIDREKRSSVSTIVRRRKRGKKDSGRKNVYGTTTKNEIAHIPKRSGCKQKTIEREHFLIFSFFSSEEIGNKVIGEPILPVEGVQFISQFEGE